MEQIPKIVMGRLGADEPGPHPDPDLLTAFAERSLSERERLQVLGHLSRCAGCRELLALSLPQTQTSEVAHYAPSASGWLRWPVLRWGALAACLVVVGAAVSLRYRTDTPETREAVSVPHMQAQSSVKPAEQAKSAVNTPATPAMEAKKSAPKRKAAENFEIAAAPSATGRLDNLAKTRPDAAPALSANEMRPAAPETSNPIANQPTLQAEATPLTLDSELATGKAKAAAKDESSSARDMVAAAPGAVSKQLSLSSVQGLMSVPRWTLAADGSLQRSFDQGRTWAAVAVPTAATLRALAATGADIWVGGTAGALYHSGDAGEHWSQVRPVARRMTLSADVIGVEFADSQHGRITTADHQIWTTTDGGNTWSVQ